ncbi:GA module-containing protein [Mycoplasmopsis bovigenitalium]|uniref:GA module-containing protein n=1 Tax=Mycoplasmopsis bovigenitalium TaxID=2112 RepID=UPI000BBA98AD|nr:GA module-containing protein [Mycoplasmopsis bovigenitalium]
MRKKTRNTLLGLAAILTICGTTSATLSTVISSKKHISEQKIVEQIGKLIEQINTDIQTLESNKNSVDTLKKAIDKSKKSLEKYKQKFNEWNKNEYKQYKSIQQPLANFGSSIKDLENKIKESEEKLKLNIQTIQNIVDNAKKTSDEAIEKLEKTSEINLPGLKQANQELHNAANELKKAKQKAQEMNSESHVDDLVLKAKEVQKAEEKVKNLINTIQNQTDKQKYDSYQDELNKHINILNKNIEESNNLNDDLSILEPFTKNFEKNNIKAKDAHNFINSIKEPLPQEITNTNNKLKDVIENSEQKINELKSKINNIKSEINNELNLLNQSQNESKSKIDSTNDIEVLADEFNNSNQRLNVEIPKLNNKIDKFKYQEASPKVIQLIENEKSLANAILQKLKNDALSHLKGATNLSNQQNEAFKNQIENATTPQEISKIKNDISLANSKEKVKKDINEIYELFNSKFKQNSLKEVEEALNREQVSTISKKLSDLHNHKQDAKSKIVNEFNNLSNSQKEDYVKEIINANTIEKVNEIVNEAQKLNEDKQHKINKINELDSLTSEDKKKLLDEIYESNSIEKNPEKTPEKVLDKATKLNNTKKESIQNIEKLENLNKDEKDIFKNLTINEFDESKINQNTQKAIEEDKNKESIKQEISSLKNKNLSEKEVNNFINDVNKINVHNENSKQELEQIKNNAKDINNEKQKLIDKIKKLDSNSIDKGQLEKQIINANGKHEAQEIFDNAELQTKKDKAKNNINELQNIDSEKQNFINRIDSANNKEQINNIVQEANELNESNSNTSNTSNTSNSFANTSSTQPTVNLHSKQIAKEKIDKLEYLSEDEKQDFKTNIDNSNDDQEIENQVSNAQTNNQNKQNIVEKIKDLDLISTNGKTSAEEYVKNNSLENSNIKHEELSAINDEKLKIRNQINNAQSVGDIDADTKRELLNKLINNDDQATLQAIKDELSKYQVNNNELIKAIADFKKLLDKFIKINEKVSFSELKNLNQKIIDNLDRNIKDYEQKLDKGINSKWLVSDYAAKVNTANVNSSYYINNLEKAIEFIGEKSRTQSINDKYLEEYHKDILKKFDTEIKCISTRNFEDFRIFAQSLSKLENINSSPIKTIANELFKNEIIHLVGNGIWSISSETVPHNNRNGYKTKVAKIYFEQGSSASNPKITIDESYYREKYKKFEIKWYGNEGWNQSGAIKNGNSYDYLSDGLIFASNDEFDTKFKIWINGNDALYIENIPSKEEYISKNLASEIQKDSDASHHIKPEHLKFIDY